MQLSKSEEQLMELIWQHGEVFMKELLDAYPEPRPAATTVATLLKRMQDKGVIAYKTYGNSRRYYPLVRKEDYFSKRVKGMIHDYFSGSALEFASFFTTAAGLTAEELEELRKIVDTEIEKKKP